MCGKLLLSIYQYLIKKFTKGYGLSNYRPIKAIMKNAEKKIKTDFAYVQGSKMFLDPTDYDYLLMVYMEYWILKQ